MVKGGGGREGESVVEGKWGVRLVAVETKLLH